VTYTGLLPPRAKHNMVDNGRELYIAPRFSYNSRNAVPSSWIIIAVLFANLRESTGPYFFFISKNLGRASVAFPFTKHSDTLGPV
jgi:hypothetical protein